jgi:hypothetical protein
MPRKNRNKVGRVERLRALMGGLEMHYEATTLVLVRTPYSPGELRSFLQQDVDAVLGSSAAKAAWLTAVQVERDTDAATDPVLRAIAAQVRATFGDAEDATAILADFGLTPRKLPERTSEAKALAAERARATRKARGTRPPTR